MPTKRSTVGPSARTIVALLAAVTLVTSPVVVTGQTIDEWDENRKFAPGEEGVGDEFGASATVEGDLAVVGAPGATNDDGEETGAVYVFARTLIGEWTQEAKLLASDGGDNDGFGHEVSLDGDTLLVAAPWADTENADEAGAAYVLTRTAPGAWTQEAKLTADGGESGDSFGQGVSLDGDRALVGASLADPDGKSASGQAYVFARDAAGTWTQQATLVAPDGDASDQFGEALSLDGDTALVGAPSDHDPGAEDTGSAYVLEDSDGGWTVQTKLDNPEPNDEDQFGAALSLDGDTALVASPFDDSDGTDYGSVYAYARGDGTWAQEATLQGSDTGFLDTFGVSVALDGDRALVGAPRDTNDNGFSVGASYLFLRDDSGSWSQETKLLPTDAGPSDEVGGAAGLDGGTALVGAPATFNFTDPGAAYVYGNLLEQVEDRTQDVTDAGGAAPVDP